LAEKENNNGDVTMTILEHLEELRSRLIKILIFAGVGFCVGYYFSETIFGYLIKPLTDVLPKGTSLIFTNITEAFFTYLKVGLLAGVFIASPFILYQIWAFISPGLYKKERRGLIPVTIISVILFVVGASFGYFVVFPFGFKFLISNYTTDMIKPMPTMKEYFSLVMWMLLAFGAIFELPVVVYLLARFGIVTHKGLRKFRRYAILGAFILGAILTPTPDIFNQSMMAGPLIVLYEISIWVAYFFGKKPQPAVEDGDEDVAETTDVAERGEEK
jgi:sec-independent protein translocase protein TatC